MPPPIEIDPKSKQSNCPTCKTIPIGPGKTRYCSAKCQQKARKDRKAKSRIADLETEKASVKTPSVTLPISNAASPHCVACNKTPKSGGGNSYYSTTCRSTARKARKAARPSPRNKALYTKPPGHGNAQDPGVKTKLSSTTFKSLWAIPERQSSKPARKTESGSLAAGKGAKKLNEGLSAKKITEGAIPDDGDDMDDSDSSHDSDELDSWGSMDDSDIEDMLSGHNEYEPNLMTTLMNTNFGYKSGEGILPDGTGYEFNFHSDSDW